ncbi:MAG: DUF6526 family protein [Bryobacteraceae bacterium]
MADTKTQSLRNHARFDPLFHRFLAPAALVLLIAAIVNVVRTPGWFSGIIVLAMLWAIVAMFKIRLYALKVQDRVIRLEERLRLERLLSEPLRSRISEFTEAQLIALRFASDAELPALAEKTLAGNLNSKQIKQAIVIWRPDHWRV